MKIIKSLKNDLIKKIARLKEKRFRDETGLFIIEGPHLVEMALDAGKLITLIIEENEVVNYASYIDEIDTLIVTSSIIKKISFSKSPQNVMGIASKDEDVLIKGNKIILLDDLQDPGNVGTILRSALAFDYDQVIVSSNSVDLYNDKVIRASQGAVFKISTFSDDLEKIYIDLKNQGYQIIVTSLDDKSISLNDLKRHDKFVIVLGNEGNGVSNLSLKNADNLVKIAMSNEIDSLNVGVAGSIVMYELNKE